MRRSIPAIRAVRLSICKGRLIGINTAILAPGGGNVGIGFAVPINMARDMMDQLIRYGKVGMGTSAWRSRI